MRPRTAGAALKPCGVMGREERLTGCYQPPALVKKRRMKRACSVGDFGLSVLSISASDEGLKSPHIYYYCIFP